MRPLRVGSLCSGYGGLEMGAELAFGPLEHIFHGEFDPAPSAVLEHRWPGVPNLGDIAAVTAANAWAGLGPIDLLCAGYPCQPFSSAGLRKGLDDPRNRWPDVHAAIRALRPRLVLLENVRGHLNRGFGTVVASLAAIGYVGRWRCVRASDAGAAHRRERLFIVAWPAEEAAPRLRGTDALGLAAEVALLPTPMTADGDRQSAAFSRGNPTLLGALLPTPTAERAGYNQGGAAGRVGPIRPSLDQIDRLLPTPRAIDGETGRQTLVDGRTAGDRGPRLGDIEALPPTPRTSDANGAGQHGDGGLDLRTAVTLLPTPKASDGEKGGPNQRGSKGDLALPAAAMLLPTPTVADSRGTRNATAGRTGPSTANDGWTLSDVAHANRWGAYSPAVARWEAVIGRSAPEPTIAGRLGRRQLSPLFVEWLMGLPAGHVTDIVAKRSAALKVLGNGVVPQAAALALQQLLAEPEQLATVQLDLLEAVPA